MSDTVLAASAAVMARPPVLSLTAGTAALLRPLLDEAPIEGLFLDENAAAGGVTWRLETADGPLDLPGSAARAWERPPYAMLLRLTADEPDRRGRVLAEAAIGTRLGFGELLQKIAATALHLLRAASEGPSDLRVDAVAPAAVLAPALAMAAGRARHALRRWRERLLVEEWAMGVASHALPALIGGERLERVQWVAPGAFGELVDPHPWPGTSRVLCEEILGPREGGRGRIVAVELDPRMRVRGGQVVLEGAHLSYPGASEHDGRVVLLPETPERGGTRLFTLARDGTLAQGCAVAPALRMADPTLFAHDGRFWIAFTDLDIGLHDNLCLLHAPSLEGPWTPHARNPVKLDIRSSRPAGPMLYRLGGMIRPAQDCARSYGAALVLNRVDTLTPERFRETPIRRIEPAPGRYDAGLHTLAWSEGLGRVLVDGKRHAFRPGALAAKAGRRLGQLLGAGADA